MSDSKKPGGADPFEENLRHILSNSEPSAPRSASPAAAPAAAPTAPAPPPPAGRLETEQRTLFWFKLLRPVAFAALLIMLAIFVIRITAVRG